MTRELESKIVALSQDAADASDPRVARSIFIELHALLEQLFRVTLTENRKDVSFPSLVDAICDTFDIKDKKRHRLKKFNRTRNRVAHESAIPEIDELIKFGKTAAVFAKKVVSSSKTVSLRSHDIAEIAGDVLCVRCGWEPHKESTECQHKHKIEDLDGRAMCRKCSWEAGCEPASCELEHNIKSFADGLTCVLCGWGPDDFVDLVPCRPIHKIKEIDGEVLCVQCGWDLDQECDSCDQHRIKSVGGLLMCTKCGWDLIEWRTCGA